MTHLGHTVYVITTLCRQTTAAYPARVRDLYGCDLGIVVDGKVVPLTAEETYAVRQAGKP